MRRRAFLVSGIAGASGLALPRWVCPQPVAEHPATEALRDGMMLIRGPANGLVYRNAVSTILVDVPAPDFVGASELYGPAPLLVNTNWRPEHTAANDALGREGAEIVAHVNTRLWMGNDFTVRWESRHHRPRAPEALPSSTFYTSRALEAADESISVGHLPQAHTDGDAYVRFERANVLFVSALLAVQAYPILDYSTGGWIRGMIEATEHLLGIADENTLIVPAIGIPQRRDALEAQLELCRKTDEVVGNAYTSAMSLDELIASNPLEAWREERGDPALFLELAYRGMWGHIRQLGLGIV